MRHGRARLGVGVAEMRAREEYERVARVRSQVCVLRRPHARASKVAAQTSPIP